MAIQTRNQSKSHISDVIGTSKDLLISELPTLRDLLRYVLFLKVSRSDVKHNTPVKDLVCNVYPKLMQIWQKANPVFEFPVICSKRRVVEKIVNGWETATNISNKRITKPSEVEQFVISLDKLFDLLKCQCAILDCVDFGCSGCSNKVHIKCLCRKEFKIPTMELPFIKAQRDKVGAVGAMQMGSVDFVDNKRRTKMLKRKLEFKSRTEKLKSVQNINDELVPIEQIDFLGNSSDEDGDKASQPEKLGRPSKSPYNTDSIDNVAMASIRYGVSARATAAIATSTLLDVGVSSDDKIIDHNKVERAKSRVMKKIQEEQESKYYDISIQGILFDGRKDITKVMLETDDSSQNFPGSVKEEHYSMCSEPGGEYLTHFTPEPATEKCKPGEQIANGIYEWVARYKARKTLVALGGDSTNVNTGWQGGAIQYVEKKLGRKLIWLICALHTNELPLRHLITNLDGETLSNNKFSGPIGKILENVTDLDINEKFTKLKGSEDLIELSDNIIDDLSDDQKYGYKMVKAIREGHVPKYLELLEIGPINHSRWLTTANRILRLWVSKHDLKGKNLKNLRFIVEFIIGVYYPQWFRIKVMNSWIDGPNHVLHQVLLVKKQRQAVQRIVWPYVMSSAWYAFSENILETMLSSKDQKDREFAVTKILEIRNGNDKGDTNVRVRKTPAIDINTTNLKELIDWNKEEVFEPVLTCSLTIDELKEFVAKPMDVPKFPVHGQSIERTVQMVTKAASLVYGHEKRDGFIRSTIEHRKVMPSNNSKKDLKNLLSNN